MHTFGAIVLAIVGILMMYAILWFGASLLFEPMYRSVGLVLPSVLLVGCSVFAYYGGIVFALNVASKSNVSS